MRIAILVEGATEKAFKPTYLIKEIFELGKRRSYSKTRDAAVILKKNNLMDAVKVCPELKAFLNTILSLCDGDII